MALNSADVDVPLNNKQANCASWLYVRLCIANPFTIFLCVCESINSSPAYLLLQSTCNLFDIIFYILVDWVLSVLIALQMLPMKRWDNVYYFDVYDDQWFYFTIWIIMAGIK